MQGLLFSNDERVPPDPAELESSAKMLAKLLNAEKECRKCRLAETRLNFVFGEGNPCADLVVSERLQVQMRMLQAGLL